MRTNGLEARRDDLWILGLGPVPHSRTPGQCADSWFAQAIDRWSSCVGPAPSEAVWGWFGWPG